MNVKRIYLIGMVYLFLLGVVEASPKDRISLEFYTDYFALSPILQQTELPHIAIEPICQDERGFTFALHKTVKTGYLRIRIFANQNGDSTLMSGLFFAASGDSITCRYTKGPGFSVYFTGRGSEKYQVQYESSLYYEDFDHQFELLKSYRKKLSIVEYRVLQTDIESNKEYNQLRIKRSALLHQRLNGDSLIASILPTLPELFSDSLAKKSKNYPYYLAKLLALVAEQTDKDILDYIKCCDDQELHDKVMLVYLREQLFDRPVAYLRSISDNLYTRDYRAIAASITETVTPGAEAYNFMLPNEYGKMVQLTDFRGKVVFLDFWFTGCSACSLYYQHVLAEVEKHFKNNPDIVFISISVDRDREKWLKSIRGESKTGYQYTSDDAVNLFTDGKASKHPVIEKYKVLGYPRPLLIDRKGVIITANGKKLRESGVGGLVEIINVALNNK